MFGTTKLIYRCLILSIFFAEVIHIAGYAQDGNTSGGSSIHTSIRSAQIVSPLSPADSAWGKMPQMKLLKVKNPDNLDLSERAEAYTEIERYGLELRAWGLNFYRVFSEDSRRYEALLMAMRAKVYYWKEAVEAGKIYAKSGGREPIPVNLAQLDAWKKQYHVLRSAYLSSDLLSEDEKLRFKKGEITSYLIGSELLSENRRGKKLNADSTLRLFETSVEAAKILSPDNIKKKGIDGTPFLSIEAIFVKRDLYGWGQVDIMNFLNKASLSRVPEVKEWAISKRAIFKLRTTPLVLKHKDILGNEIDLSKLKGKVILIDIWATWCVPCVESMPKYVELYRKYKDEGFVVLSMAINSEKDLDQILKIKDKFQIDFPLLIIGGKDRENRESSFAAKLFKDYGLFGVPQLFLFNKEGVLVEFGGPLGTDDLEKIVEKQLKL